MAIAQGVNKVIGYKKETAWAVAPGATSGKELIRVTGVGNLTKATYASAEIARHRQVEDMRHGTRSAGYSFNGELAAGKYLDFWAAGMRQAFQTAPTTGALVNVTASASAPHFVRASGSFLTDGLKVGDVIRWSGWTTTAVANNAKNFLITALTATDMTVVALNGTAVVAKVSGDSVTGLLTGKRTWVPATSHTDESFYFEDWYSDIAQSEQFSGCKMQTMAVDLPSTGLATINAQFLGKDIVSGTSQYFTTPVAPTQSGRLAAVNGVVILNGVKAGVITGMNFTADLGLSSDTVVGSNVAPAINTGIIGASGQITVLFEDAVMRDAFINETVVKIVGAFTASNAANADFVSFSFPAVKMGGASKNDGASSIVQTLPFTALKSGAAAGTDTLDTTIVIQDSLAT